MLQQSAVFCCKKFAIHSLYDRFLQKSLPSPKDDVVEKYNRIELTKELSTMFGFLAE